MAALHLRLGAAANMDARLHSPSVAANMAASLRRGGEEAGNMATPFRQILVFRNSTELLTRVRNFLLQAQPRIAFVADRLGI